MAFKKNYKNEGYLLGLLCLDYWTTTVAQQSKESLLCFSCNTPAVLQHPFVQKWRAERKKADGGGRECVRQAV